MSEKPNETDYWSTLEGVSTRIDQIAHLLSWGSLNTAIKETWGYAPEDKVLTWRTFGDANVCDICWDGEGTTYTVDDPMLPDLPDDTHPLCRCFFEIEPFKVVP